MTEMEKQPKTKAIKKSKYPVDVEAEKRFDSLKKKYSNAIAFLLVKNVAKDDLQSFFASSEDNKRRYDTLKKFRAAIIEERPRAKIWVDKAFYLKIELGEPVVSSEGSAQVTITLGDCVFKQSTNVVKSRPELDAYLETIAKIIEAEKLWADPDMADFDIGERDYLNKDQPAQTAKPETTV